MTIDIHGLTSSTIFNDEHGLLNKTFMHHTVRSFVVVFFFLCCSLRFVFQSDVSIFAVTSAIQKQTTQSFAPLERASSAIDGGAT